MGVVAGMFFRLDGLTKLWRRFAFAEKANRNA